MNEQTRTQSDRSTSAEHPHGHRRHMGVASADPEYLPLTPQEQARERAIAREQAAQERHLRSTFATGQPRSLRHSDRYLQTPKPGHSIFVSQRERRARRFKVGIALISAISIALALVWFFLLK